MLPRTKVGVEVVSSSLGMPFSPFSFLIRAMYGPQEPAVYEAPLVASTGYFSIGRDFSGFPVLLC
jgi:hypothetical protein